ncbi:PREDICTED: putative mediator of RNA polymerase II transcription subunit 26 [Drosophila arizonae]|uniref:Mediator of RNA polymerase II transcription subunit 26 n=1 Tax=Drosophila arizonae TaxID=7263 RepID=A0ABM1PBG9_DROAR|nr:PREDICTED: putative mediator of RNA polymerase II transcription subunit 26 [Drosophila arizonae]
MRLLLLSLLALGAHAHSIGYRTNLLAYAPARGEFPVQSEIVQGYTRYLDSNGAERLIAFNYPEPLYGIRTVAQSDNNFVRTSAKVEPQQQHLALFRAWCEQRYNALRLELERLRAEGKQPAANILSQYEPLEQIIKMNAFEAVPGLSPELQRVRDEQMRIWNEARLKVINAEAALPQQSYVKQNIFTAQPQQQAQAQQPLVKQFAFTSQTNAALDSPKPVQETEEVKRAREEHLRRYNEALQQQQKQDTLESQPQPIQQQEQLVKAIPISTEQQQQQQAIEDTPEVQRAREEHFKLYKEALLRQATEAQAQPQPQPPPQAGIKTYDASSSGAYVSAQTPAQNLQPDNFNQVKVKAEDSIRYDEREQAAQLEQERREEIRLMELERQREEKRLMEERRMLEAERIALEQQEQQRMEAAAQAAQPVQPAQPQTIAQQQQVQNGFFLRIQSGAPSQISAPSQPSSEAYILAEHNPFLVRYVPQPQKAQQLSSTGLSEWEQATRDHFKAHEIALEQLRLANLKDANQIPCTH